MNWELKECKAIDCVMDNSGIYTVIHRIEQTAHSKGHFCSTVLVRVDIMASVDDMPLMSFVGKADDVRKHVIRWIVIEYLYESTPLSAEHASYIGSEIAKAELQVHYVQS